MKKLSIIIVSYNVCYFLEQALLSVRKALQHVDAEVFVVDNNSADHTVAMVQRRFPEVKLIVNDTNRGFSKANNQALEKAAGEYVLLLNPDTVVGEDTFIRCLQFMARRPEAGGLGVKMLDGKGHFLPESMRGLPTPAVAFYKITGLTALFPTSRIFSRYYLGYLDKDQVQEVDVLAGAFMFLRRASLQQTGWLDESFFMYGEDIDLSYRLQQAGYKNFYLPHTQILHYKGESTHRGSLNYVYLFYRAMSVFVKKHFRGRQAVFFSALIQLAIIGRAVLSAGARFTRFLFPFLVDAGAIYGGMYLLKTLWERAYKPAPGHFPDTFMEVAVPAYLVLWIGTSYLAGAYDKPFRVYRLLRGIFIGTILISACSDFLDQYRFSKAMILLGQVWAFLVIWLRLKLTGLLRSGSGRPARKEKKIAVVGGEEAYQRVAALLKDARVPAQLLGFLSANPADKTAAHYLGELRQLNDVTRLYQLEELIFSGKDLAAGEIMEWMVKLKKHDLHYKILPEGSEYIIGSHSKNSPGDYYALEFEQNLLQPVYLRQKRLLDISLTLFFLLSWPLLIGLLENKKNFFRNCGRVLSGKSSWVGLRHTRSLHKTRPGILSPADLYQSLPSNPEAGRKVEVLYAKEYSVLTDLDIIRKGFSQLGRQL